MSTLEETASRADVDALITSTPGETVDCTVCGRNCRHIPSAAGGGSAGGMKGEKYEPTPRSELHCPACLGKPHRKEGRIYQEISCQYRQAMLALGATALLHPNEAIYLRLAEMARTGLLKETPTEAQVTSMIRKSLGMPDPEPRRRKTSVAVPQDKDKEEIAQGDETVKTEPIALEDITLPVVKAASEPKLKVKKAKEPKQPRAKKAPKETPEQQADNEAGIPVASEDVENLINGDEGEQDYNPFANLGAPFPDDDDEDLTPEQQAALARK